MENDPFFISFRVAGLSARFVLVVVLAPELLSL
jgi:hypothetical protein